jgi:hypothetical protein
VIQTKEQIAMRGRASCPSLRHILAALGALIWLVPSITRPASADPPLRCLWRPSRSVIVIPSAGTARIQYTQLFDDALAAVLSKSLGPDRTLKFRYESDRPDDYILPNGVSMKRFHGWLASMLDAWNRQPLMPLRLTLERGKPATENVIKLDEDSSETPTNAGLGGYSFRLQGDQVDFRCRAVLNVGPGSLARRELVEAIAKHELGHCLGLRHTSHRGAAMSYTTGVVDYAASVGFFALDDLLGVRSVWARTTPGFGALSARLLYPDASPVGGADVAAVDDSTGEVIASGVTDGDREGLFRIELPAGRRVRFVAHPLHADAALFGEHFMPAEMLTPGGFEPTELRADDGTSVFTVPDARTQDLGTFSVGPPADPPLRHTDAPVASLLPGQRQHIAFGFSGLADNSPDVQTTLQGLSVKNVRRVEDRLEFDVQASADTVGPSGVRFRSGSAVNFQVGSIWVRPPEGLVRAVRADPITLVRGGATEISITGYGLDEVTGARLVQENDPTGLPVEIEKPSSHGLLKLKATAPAGAVDGPWELALETSQGEVPQAPEPRPRFWIVRGRIEARSTVDLGDVPVNQPAEFTVDLTSSSSKPYHLSSWQWASWMGNIIADARLVDFPELEPFGTGTLRLSFSPKKLGLGVVYFHWLADDKVDAATEVRFWGVPR